MNMDRRNGNVDLQGYKNFSMHSMQNNKRKKAAKVILIGAARAARKVILVRANTRVVVAIRIADRRITMVVEIIESS